MLESKLTPSKPKDLRAAGRALLLLVLNAFGVAGEAEAAAQRVSQLRSNAEAGHAKAQTELAKAFAEDADDGQALAWNQRAAEQGEPHAQWQLGRHYEFGAGAAIDLSAAAKWYGRAARQGLPSAQIDLAQLLESDRLDAADFVEALKWFTLAAARGSEVARVNRERLSCRLSAEELKEARGRAESFVAQLEQTVPMAAPVPVASAPNTATVPAAGESTAASISSLITSPPQPPRSFSRAA